MRTGLYREAESIALKAWRTYCNLSLERLRRDEQPPTGCLNCWKTPWTINTSLQSSRGQWPRLSSTPSANVVKSVCWKTSLIKKTSWSSWNQTWMKSKSHSTTETKRPLNPGLTTCASLRLRLKIINKLMKTLKMRMSRRKMKIKNIMIKILHNQCLLNTLWHLRVANSNNKNRLTTIAIVILYPSQ